MSNTAGTLAKRAVHVSKRLIFSYVLDWVFIIAIAGVGAAFNRIHYSNKRAFYLQDPSLSYPYHTDTVTPGVLLIVALVAPGVITFVVSLLFVPGAGAPRGTPQALKWRRKLWEWNTAWMGLALSCAAAFMITEGLKDLAGKPRPHAIARCRPNLDLISQYQVGGLGTTLGPALPIMVDAGICQETDPQTLRDTFASWPSGHSSFSFAGLLYLSFFLSAKFAVTIPFLSPLSWRKQQQTSSTFDNHSSQPTADQVNGGSYINQVKGGQGVTSSAPVSGQLPIASSSLRASTYAPRNQAAAPPVYLLVIVFVPIGTALFVCVSRWFDYHHHGFDIISGALIGIITSWFSFNYYHMPIRRGAGWSWGARTRERALWLGVGREGYVGNEGWQSKKYDGDHVTQDVPMRDLEAGKTSESATYQGTEAGSERELVNHNREIPEHHAM